MQQQQETRTVTNMMGQFMTMMGQFMTTMQQGNTKYPPLMLDSPGPPSPCLTILALTPVACTIFFV